MGKNWNGPRNGAHDFSSCRGHGVVIGTCDAARERETSKELVNLLNQAIEEVYPESLHEPAEEEDPYKEKESIENLLKAELNEVKQRKHAATQNAVSIKTDVKGITLVKLTRRKFCPIKLVNAIFERVKRENAPCCRHVIRIVPLKYVFFPNEDELRANLNLAITEGLTGMGLIGDTATSEETVEPAAKRARTDEEEVPSSSEEQEQQPSSTEAKKKLPYVVQFKSRNHNVLTKDLTVSFAAGILAPHGYGDFRTPEVIIMIEALKNICGVSWFKSNETHDNFNIRKFQADLTEKAAEKATSKPVAESDPVVEKESATKDS